MSSVHLNIFFIADESYGSKILNLAHSNRFEGVSAKSRTTLVPEKCWYSCTGSQPSSELDYDFKAQVKTTSK